MWQLVKWLSRAKLRSSCRWARTPVSWHLAMLSLVSLVTTSLVLWPLDEIKLRL